MSKGTTIFGDKKFPLFKPCSVQHDEHYLTRRVSRKVADEHFRICMAKVVADLEKVSDPETVKQYKRAAAIRYRLVRALGWLMYYT